MKQIINATISLVLIFTMTLSVCPEPAFALSQMMRQDIGPAMIATVNDVADEKPSSALRIVPNQMTITERSSRKARYWYRKPRRWEPLGRAYRMVLSGENDSVVIPSIDHCYLRLDTRGTVYLRAWMIPVPFGKGSLRDCKIKLAKIKNHGSIDLGELDTSSLRCVVRKLDVSVISVSFADGKGNGRCFTFTDDGAVVVETMANASQNNSEKTHRMLLPTAMTLGFAFWLGVTGDLAQAQTTVDADYFQYKLDSMGIRSFIVQDANEWRAIADRYFDGDTMVGAFALPDKMLVFRDSTMLFEVLPHEYVHLKQKTAESVRMFRRLEAAIQTKGSPALRNILANIKRYFEAGLVHREIMEVEFYAYYYGFLISGHYDLINNDKTGLYRMYLNKPLILVFAQFDRCLDPVTRQLLYDQLGSLSLPVNVRMERSPLRDITLEKVFFSAA
jgi:hypothetical protein